MNGALSAGYLGGRRRRLLEDRLPPGVRADSLSGADNAEHGPVNHGSRGFRQDIDR